MFMLHQKNKGFSMNNPVTGGGNMKVFNLLEKNFRCSIIVKRLDNAKFRI